MMFYLENHICKPQLPFCIQESCRVSFPYLFSVSVTIAKYLLYIRPYGGASGKEPACQSRRCKRREFSP